MGAFSLDIVNDIAFISVTGILDLDALLNIFAEIDKIENKTGRMYHRFVDLSDITETAIEYHQLEELARERRKNLPIPGDTPIRSTFVVKDQIAFGLARTYEMLMENEGFEVRVFMDKEEAAKWMNIRLEMLKN